DSNGGQMRLEWRVVDIDSARQGSRYYWAPRAPEWLDERKMAALGFDTTLPNNEIGSGPSFRRLLGRDVLLVLELDGPACQEMLRRTTAVAEKLMQSAKPDEVKQASEMLAAEKNSNSRLFVVDAGLDATELRSKYADRTRYAIVRGRVEPSDRSVRSGSVEAVSVEEINV